MVMQVEPFDKGVAAVRRKVGRVHVVLTSASGKRFTEADAKRLAAYDQVIFLCGRYEGVDHRVEEHVAHESLSIGDYVLTGGELPALVMVDAVARLIPGVLGKESSLDMESHATPGVLEYPQYTRPEAYKMRGKTGDGKWKLRQIKVPAVLLSGHHEKIAAWRQKQTKGHTRNT
jgi:tRNA (guanine37-N1)-methyltransferase